MRTPTPQIIVRAAENLYGVRGVSFHGPTLSFRTPEASAQEWLKTLMSSRPMPEEDESIKTLLALTETYTHLIGTPEGNSPFALVSLGAGDAEKADRREGVPHPVFETLWRSGWIEVELQASDLSKRLYRISSRGRAHVQRLQSAAGDGAGI